MYKPSLKLSGAMNKRSEDILKYTVPRLINIKICALSVDAVSMDCFSKFIKYGFSLNINNSNNNKNT